MNARLIITAAVLLALMGCSGDYDETYRAFFGCRFEIEKAFLNPALSTATIEQRHNLQVLCMRSKGYEFDEEILAGSKEPKELMLFGNERIYKKMH